MLLKEIADAEIADITGQQVPGDGVATAPMAERLSARVQRHPNRVASVETGAAHLGELPIRAEIAGAHLTIGLESAGCKDLGLGSNRSKAIVVARLYPDSR